MVLLWSDFILYYWPWRILEQSKVFLRSRILHRHILKVICIKISNKSVHLLKVLACVWKAVIAPKWQKYIFSAIQVCFLVEIVYQIDQFSISSNILWGLVCQISIVKLKRSVTLILGIYCIAWRPAVAIFRLYDLSQDLFLCLKVEGLGSPYKWGARCIVDHHRV